jgi:phenylalanine-4-hydroxylase
MERFWAAQPELFHPWYFRNTPKLLAFRDKIPHINELREILAPIGWGAEHVDGLAPAWQIADLLHRQIMPVARRLRAPEQVFFANEPDLIHDIFGHLPCLFEPEYRTLLKAWTTEASRQPVTDMDRVNYYLNRHIARTQGRLCSDSASSLEKAVRALENFTDLRPSPTLLWEKVYFWIFEFGLVAHEGRVQVLGAGLITSLRELERFVEKDMSFKPLDWDTLFSPYHIASEQDLYHTLSDLEACHHLFEAVQVRLQSALSVPSPEYAHA